MAPLHLAVADSIKDWHKYYCGPDKPSNTPIPEKYVQDCLASAIRLPDSELYEFLKACGYEETP